MKIILSSVPWLSLFGLIGSFNQALAVDSYITRAGAEPDKGASAWLILRHIDSSAQFKVLQPGSELVHGHPFDVPESRFKRGHRYSTFETLLHAYKLTDPAAIRLGRIIHDLEINVWGNKIDDQSQAVEHLVKILKTSVSDSDIPLPCYIAFFDQVSAHLEDINQLLFNYQVPSPCRKNQMLNQ